MNRHSMSSLIHARIVTQHMWFWSRERVTELIKDAMFRDMFIPKAQDLTQIRQKTAHDHENLSEAFNNDWASLGHRNYFHHIVTRSHGVRRRNHRL